MSASKAERLAPIAGAVTIALLVTLPETGAVVVLVGVQGAVGAAVALVGFAIIAMAHGIVAVAVASVGEAALVAALEAIRECRLLIAARRALREERAVVAAAERGACV